MKSQTPALGISARNPAEYHWDSYHIECDCTCPEHALEVHISVEREEADDDYVAVEIYSELYTPWQVTTSWKLWFKMLWQLLTKRTVRLSHSIILKDQAALNFADALRVSVERHQAKLKKTAYKDHTVTPEMFGAD